ncbi:sulfotransferase [Pseudomonadota bacterium]
MIKFNLVVPKSEKKFDELLEKGQFKNVVKLCKKLCQKKPNAVHYYFLAMGYSGLGKSDDAISALEKAIDYDRDVSLLYEQLYATLLRKGGPNEAMTYFYRSLQNDPHNLQLYRFLRFAMEVAGTRVAFLNLMEQLRQGDPTLIEPLLETASYYQVIGKKEDAEGVLLEVLRRDPEHSEALYRLAGILSRAGKLDAAAACLRMVLDNEPSMADAAALMSYVYYVRKDYETALEYLKPFLTQVDDIAPMVVVRYLHLAQKMGLEQDALRLANIYLRNNRSPFVGGDLQLIYAELAKIYNAQGDYDKAFRFMKVRNDNIARRFDIKGFVRTGHLLSEAFNREYFDNLTAISSKGGKSPIFIVGMPRSGTSLTEQILGQHSQVYPAGECLYMTRIVERLTNPDMGGTSDLQAVLTHLNSDPKHLEEVRDHYYGLLEIEHKFSEPYFTDKLPQNFRYLGFIKSLFPDAKIIHCRRNALDICVSCYFQSFSEQLAFTNDLGMLGEFYLEYERFMQHWRDIGIEMLEVDYEKTVENMEPVTRQILEFCGLPWEDACLDFHKSERFVPTASSEQVNKPIYTSSVERWRRYEKHLKPLIDVIGVR